MTDTALQHRSQQSQNQFESRIQGNDQMFRTNILHIPNLHDRVNDGKGAGANSNGNSQQQQTAQNVIVIQVSPTSDSNKY